MKDNKQYQVLWAGVTPIVRGSKRVYALLEVEQNLRINFPDNTEGMLTYDEWQHALSDFDIIATDQETIDESWENFFTSKNWGKRIFQFKGEELVEVKPGFSLTRK